MTLQIAIDGPAASGKSTDAKLLAERINGLYVNTHSGLTDPERQTVSSQSFPAGTELRHGSVVEVTLIDSDEDFLGKY